MRYSLQNCELINSKNSVYLIWKVELDIEITIFLERLENTELKDLPRFKGFLPKAPLAVLVTAVWNSLDITGHVCPYIPSELPECWRKLEDTRPRNGHFAATDKLIVCCPF